MGNAANVDKIQPPSEKSIREVESSIFYQDTLDHIIHTCDEDKIIDLGTSRLAIVVIHAENNCVRDLVNRLACLTNLPVGDVMGFGDKETQSSSTAIQRTAKVISELMCPDGFILHNLPNTSDLSIIKELMPPHINVYRILYVGAEEGEGEVILFALLFIDN
jgi:hypothetical protein